MNADQLDVWEQEYRRFLALRLAHPDTDTVPCKIVDAMWHRHILDTAAYRTDCDAIFGHCLDHFPYFGMRSSATPTSCPPARWSTPSLPSASRLPIGARWTAD